MRITTTLTGVSLAFVLTGCGTAVEKDGVTVWCKNRDATINHSSSHIDVRPASVNLCAGYKLTLKLVPPVATGMARTKQPTLGGPDDWLDRDNVGAFIEVTPRDDTSTGPHEVWRRD